MENDDLINASPTKKLFISMLTRDITLNDAIGDLIDNCIDGALKIRPDKNFQGLKVSIIADQDHFEIIDNCSGIDEETAKKYAFRFGRTDKTPTLENSVGQFGIGMKRALFKLGDHFEIKSTTENSSFVIDVDVPYWEKEENWNFKFSSLIGEKDGQLFPQEQRGTQIIITKLHKEVIERFSLENFRIELINEISVEHLKNLQKGLIIEINNQKLENYEPKLINSKKIKPGLFKKEYSNGLTVKILVGIAEENSDLGGWYIYCNDRLTLGPEQTSKTGWGAKKPIQIPKYHTQFNRFRGFVYFESADTGLLPWNSSKNDIDKDSPIYLKTKQQMVSMMRPVIDFLNKIHDESNPKINNKPLNKILTESIELSQTTNELIANENDLESNFLYPENIQGKEIENLVEISYYQPKNRIDNALKITGINSYSELGLQSFEYFYKKEIGD